MRNFYVYILASETRVLYTGVTRDLTVRLWYHRQNPGSFASWYHCTRLVYYETSPTAREAIAREKQIKNWTRRKKLGLIERLNPQWLDLAANFGIAPDLAWVDSSTPRCALRSE